MPAVMAPPMATAVKSASPITPIHPDGSCAYATPSPKRPKMFAYTGTPPNVASPSVVTPMVKDSDLEVLSDSTTASVLDVNVVVDGLQALQFYTNP